MKGAFENEDGRPSPALGNILSFRILSLCCRLFNGYGAYWGGYQENSRLMKSLSTTSLAVLLLGRKPPKSATLLPVWTAATEEETEGVDNANGAAVGTVGAETVVTRSASAGGGIIVVVVLILRSLPRPLMPLLQFLYKLPKYSHISCSQGSEGAVSAEANRLCKYRRVSEWNLF